MLINNNDLDLMIEIEESYLYSMKKVRAIEILIEENRLSKENIMEIINSKCPKDIWFEEEDKNYDNWCKFNWLNEKLCQQKGYFEKEKEKFGGEE